MYDSMSVVFACFSVVAAVVVSVTRWLNLNWQAGLTRLISHSDQSNPVSGGDTAFLHKGTGNVKQYGSSRGIWVRIAYPQRPPVNYLNCGYYNYTWTLVYRSNDFTGTHM